MMLTCACWHPQEEEVHDDALRMALEETERELAEFERMESGTDSGPPTYRTHLNSRDSMASTPRPMMMRPPPAAPLAPRTPPVQEENRKRRPPSNPSGLNPSTPRGSSVVDHFPPPPLAPAPPPAPGPAPMQAYGRSSLGTTAPPAPDTSIDHSPPPPPGPPPGPPPPRRRGEMPAAAPAIGGGVSSPPKLGFAKNRVAPEAADGGGSMWDQYGTGPPEPQSTAPASSYV